MRKRDRIKQKLKALTEHDILQAMKKTLDNAYVFFKKKLGDYGTETYKQFGAIAIYLRIKEKMNRLDKLLLEEENPNFESIKDNVNDVFVLAATMFAMIEEEVVDIEEMQEQYRLIMGENEKEDEEI